MFRHVRRICSSLPSARAYSTRNTRKDLAARTASTPLAVRERREKQLGLTPGPGETDATPEGLTPSDFARYKRHKALGTIPKTTDGKYQSPKEWMKRRNARRSRIRGFRTIRRAVPAKEDPNLTKTIQEVDAVGQPVYLPNIIFRLVRNHTPEGQDYNPFEATFRVPPSITKTDIRSYLFAVYGVKTTYIRTDLYYGRMKPRGQSDRKLRSVYKRAVVGLVHPFYYPHRLEDMPEEEREKREDFIEQQYFIKEGQKMFAQSRFRSAAMAARGENSKEWKFDAGSVKGRGKILKEVARRRQLKEQMVAGLVGEWQRKRMEGKTVTVEMPRNRKPKKEAETNV
ncbi:hypothetical protein J3R30DRAFT_3537647 [Lentinula aciculospora]|uniref:Large ribosomal subunit protein uL23m n=1 Tax=Lentinula aciculospora TaxID=153920 RepID=A0A9W8ZYX6_9AGAR|nr:hypothetical protein J3R30DRAFT_3537647 [Lentinula aciculospora]